MPIAKPEERVRLLGEEIVRLAELYRIAHAVYEAQPEVAFAEDSTLWPRAENLIRPRSPTFGSVALRYLSAVSPHAADVEQVSRYVRHWIGPRFSQSACSQAMLELVRAGVAEKAGQRGAWRAAGARGGQPKQGGLPVINPVGLAGEVRRFILAYGPMGTAELMRRIGHFFTVAGRNPIDNFHTVVGKAQGIRYCRGVGFVVDDLLHLEPALRSTLRYRREDDGPPSREDAE